MLHRRLAIPLGLALLLTGCFLDRSAAPCSSDSQCPGAMRCAAGACVPANAPDGSVRDSGARDSGVDAATVEDAGSGADAQPPADSGRDASDTCSNGVIDSGEVGVDCGGPCPPCAGPLGVEGLVLWLRADAATILGDGSVVEWASEVGGHRFLPASGALAPRVVSTAGVSAAVAFTGSERLDSVEPIPLAGTSALSSFYVSRCQVARALVLESSGAYSANPGAFADFCSGGRFESRVHTTVGGPGTGAASSEVVQGTWRTLGAVRNLARPPGEQVRIHVGGVAAGEPTGSGTGAAPFTDQVWSIGGRSGTPRFDGLTGEIAEIAVYARELSPAEIAHLEAYFRTRYAL